MGQEGSWSDQGALAILPRTLDADLPLAPSFTRCGAEQIPAVARYFEAVDLGILGGQKRPLRGLQFLEWPG
jgi:hypothetical protein